MCWIHQKPGRVKKSVNLEAKSALPAAGRQPATAKRQPDWANEATALRVTPYRGDPACSTSSACPPSSSGQRFTPTILHHPLPPDPLWKRQAWSWGALQPFQHLGARAQQVVESQCNLYSSHRSSGKEVMGSRSKHQSCGYFCPRKAELLYTSISLHVVAEELFKPRAALPSNSGVAGHRLLARRLESKDWEELQEPSWAITTKSCSLGPAPTLAAGMGAGTARNPTMKKVERTVVETKPG